jgi:hypothetical protein
MMKVAVLALAAATVLKTEKTEASRTFQRTMAKALALGVECEEMCKQVGAYPQGCACPGWNGMPASSDDMDTRNCYAKYCVPIAHTADPCPSDAFETCVSEKSKVPALLQVDWSARIQLTKSALAVMVKKQKRFKADAVAMGVQCEEMCKAMGNFPEGCQCPGWNGTPGSSDDIDDRNCYSKYCKPIAHTADPCPSDAFVTCVSEHTQHAALLQTNWVSKKQAIQAAARRMAIQDKKSHQ